MRLFSELENKKHYLRNFAGSIFKLSVGFPVQRGLKIICLQKLFYLSVYRKVPSVVKCR